VNAIGVAVRDMICHLSKTHAGKSRLTQAGSHKHTDINNRVSQGKRKADCETMS
jgi:hypothetical protein